MRILILNGPNLNLLGQREPQIYGTNTLNQMEESIKKVAQPLNVQVDFFQSNSEGAIIDTIHAAKDKGIDGIVLNAGAYTHYSYAILDAIHAVTTPVVEVHLSPIYQREAFRHHSVIAPACIGQISGFGIDSYRLGLLALLNYLEK